MLTRKIKVLLVDDEPAFTSLLSDNLEYTGRFVVRQENDSRRAITAARDFRPDAILLDVSMPNLDGGDLLTAFRNEPSLKDVPIVFLTALVQSEEVPMGGAVSGGHRFLPKPIAVAEIIECIDAQLKLRGRAEDAGGIMQPSSITS